MVIRSFIGAACIRLITNKSISCFRFSFLVVIISLIAACSGGGGGSDGGGDIGAPDKEPTTSGSITVNPNTVFLSDVQTAQIASTDTNADGSTQLVTIANSTLGTELVAGSVLMATGGTDSRFPLGFAGKVVNVTTGQDGTSSVTLTKATLADIVQKSSFQSNEIELNSTNFIGIISPSAVKESKTTSLKSLSLLRTSKSVLNGGVVFTEPNNVGDSLNSAIRYLGIGDVNLGGISLNLEVKLGDLGLDPKRFKPYGFGTEASFSVTGSINNLRLRENHDFDKTVGVVTGLKSIDARITGDVNFDVRFNGGVEANIGYFSQAWFEVEEEAKKLLGVSAELSGLDSKDKIGKFPLAGLVFAAKCPPSGCPIIAGQTQTPLRAAKAGGVIVWLYLVVDVEVKLDGELGARMSDGHLSVGFQKTENGKLDAVREISYSGVERFIEAPYLEGDISVDGRLGFEIDVDFFTLGVRLGNAAAFAGVQEKVTVKTNSLISYGATGVGDPWTWEFSDEVCGQASVSTGLIFSIGVDLGYEVDTKFKKISGSTSYHDIWPTEEEALIPGWNAALFTLSEKRFCLPTPEVNKILTTLDVPTKTLTIDISGVSLPDDLLLDVTPSNSCTGIQRIDINSTSASYECQLADAVSTLDYKLISHKAEDVDISLVTDQLGFSVMPLPPKNFVASAGDSQVTVSWDSVVNATSYNLYWSPALPVTTITGNKIEGILNNTYVHTGLQNGAEYYYAVTAANASGESEEGDNSGLAAIPRSILNDRVLTLSESEGNWEIYSVGLDGADSINLTNNPAEDRLPSLSPERGRIAFVSDRNGNNEIYVMTSDGANPTRLTNNTADDATPVWSPDGKKIAFVSERNGNYEIYVIDADGQNELRLTNTSADDTFPSWSPDSKRIAFVSERDGDEEIYIMNADASGDAVNLTNNSGSDTIPYFSPDGAWISFVSDRDGTYDLWVMDTNGENLRKISTGTDNVVGWYAWSPDGTQIAFDSQMDGDYEVYVTNFDGTNLRQLTTNSATDQFATWVWDGNKIVFISDRDGSYQIYIMDPDGGNPVNISNDNSTIALPMASPVYQTGGGCFIATAAYGSYLEPEVMVLRELRDEYLLTNDVGKAFVKYYYKWSPPLADVIAGYEPLRIIVRISLTPLVYAVKYPAISGVLLTLMMFAFIFYLRVYKKKTVLQ